MSKSGSIWIANHTNIQAVRQTDMVLVHKFDTCTLQPPQHKTYRYPPTFTDAYKEISILHTHTHTHTHTYTHTHTHMHTHTHTYTHTRTCTHTHTHTHRSIRLFFLYGYIYCIVL